MRHAKQLRSKIEKTSDPEDLQKLERELHVAQVDEAYALNYPHAEPYISLYPKTKNEDDDDGAPEAEAKTSGGAQRRPPMWATVEKAMEEGPEALKALRERRSADESTGSAQSKGAPNKSRAKKPTPLSQQLKPPVRPPPLPSSPAVKAVGKDGKQPPRNRRERRALMRKTAPPVQKDEDEDDGEGFFEEA